MNESTELVRLALALGPRRPMRNTQPGAPPEEVLEQHLSEGRSCHAWGDYTGLAAVMGEMRRIAERLAQRGARFLFPGDEEFPAALARCPSPPRVLFVEGRIPSLPWVALVGSRAAKVKYVEATRKLAADLGHAGWGVVSGGALGIDGAAHLGALEAGCSTVVLLGSGLDQLYPPRHGELFRQVSARGALISPFPPGSPPRRAHFLQRNALIAGMARGVVVVEAQLRSGALNTARCAREMGIPLMALDSSPGARRLLLGGAARVESAENILSVIAGGPGAAPPAPEDPDQLAVLEILGGGELSLDQIAQGLGWRAARTAGALLRMELLGFVLSVADGHFRRVFPP